jgi:hypothetical protein
MNELNSLSLLPDDRRRPDIRSTRLRFLLHGFAITVLCAYLCAAAFVLGTLIALPPTDAAYRSPLMLLDPFVWTVAIPVATVVAVIVFPFALFSLWRRDVRPCTLFVLGITLVTVLCVTPFLGLPAIPISASVTVIALLFCRFTDFPVFRQRPDSTRF